jgi:phosphoribosylformimino-5-aminoimidazole carboxamide ribotide isomerase
MLGVLRVRLLWPYWLVSHSHQDISDLSTVQRLSNGRVDLTYGRLAARHCCVMPVLIANVISALDIFGGTLVRFQDLVEWNKTGLSGL